MPVLALSPDQLFMYCFVPLGALAVLVGVLRAAFHPQPIKPWGALLLAGLLLGGTGGFGPGFLTTYGDFLEKLASLDPTSEEGKKQYTKLAEDVAAGKVEEKYQPVAKALLKEKAGSDADSLLDASLKSATPEGRKVIEEVKVDLDRRSRAAVYEAAGAAAAPVKVPANVDFEKLAPETLRDLNTRSDDDLRKFSIDPAKLRPAAKRRVRAPGGP